MLVEPVISFPLFPSTIMLGGLAISPCWA